MEVDMRRVIVALLLLCVFVGALAGATRPEPAQGWIEDAVPEMPVGDWR